ncbi:uncharacterized protein [Cebidichthys violaceus]|uniref:uncharacterized protein n=1 Tax=Cebidichthys violaceus TaxID=271503 RepID=UPI0035C95193
MSGTRLLRLRVTERLEAAVEEIFGLVEKTIEEYEEGAVRSKREILQLKQQIEQLTVLKPEVVLPRADTQLVSKKRRLSLKRCEIKVDEVPVPEEMEIQDHARVKVEQVEKCTSPDMEADASNNAEVKKEIELLAVLKAEVTSFKTDTEEMFPSQQPDRLKNVEEIKTQIKEEQEERCISPDTEADTSNEDEVGHPDSEPDANCELLPPSTAETASKGIGDEWNEGGGSSSSRRGRRVHVFEGLEQHRRKDKSCRFCGESFEKDSFLIRHVAMSHKGHKAFKCPECKKEFDQRFVLIQHTRIHTGEKPFRCDYCAKAFAQNCNRVTHMRRHTEEESYFCNKCRKRFRSRSHFLLCVGKQRKCAKLKL